MSTTPSLNPNTEPQIHTASSSQSRLIHFSHTWSIDNFSLRFDSSPGSKLESRDFSAGGFKFALVLYPNGKTEESRGYMSLFLVIRNDNWKNVGCKFSILNDKEKQFKIQDIRRKFHFYFNSNISESRKEMGVEKFISVDELFAPSNGILPSNKLTIYAEISYLEDELTTDSTPYNQALIGSEDALEDYAKLLKSGKMSDVVLVVSGTELRAHKLILSARSPVFCAMFEHDLMEKQNNRVEITDVKYEVFQQLLSYIYTSKIDLVEQNIEEMLAVSDKYQLIELKSKCELFLCNKVSVETAPNFLLLADSYNADKLKATVLDFMKRQSKETIEALIDSELLVDMFRSVAKKSDHLEK